MEFVSYQKETAAIGLVFNRHNVLSLVTFYTMGMNY